MLSNDLRQRAALIRPIPKMEFKEQLERAARLVEARLEALLGGDAGAPGAEADTLAEAMRYAVLGGGKRLRPFLLMQSAALFGVAEEASLDAACALECVHCYSLVHDDLPAMDDDDMRRGRPTVHKAYDEATAILAGDGLLTLAFEILGAPSTNPDPAIRAELVLGLAKAAGWQGMVLGQALDLSDERGGLSPRRGRPHAGAQDRRAVPLRLRGRRCSRPRRRVRSGRRCSPMPMPSARPSSSPTICSMRKATRARSARPWPRMPAAARRR